MCLLVATTAIMSSSVEDVFGVVWLIMLLPVASMIAPLVGASPIASSVVVISVAGGL